MKVRLAVVLDNIRSVHNVGSIFRTADAVGAERVVCCGITPGPLDRFGAVRPDFAKVALGAEQSIAWEAGGSGSGSKDTMDTIEVIERLKTDGWKIFAVEQAPDSTSYFNAWNFMKHAEIIRDVARDEAHNIKIALVLGAEVDGVAPEVLREVDAVLEIPMSGKKESLNVAVAFGVVAFALRDSRDQA